MGLPEQKIKKFTRCRVGFYRVTASEMIPVSANNDADIHVSIPLSKNNYNVGV